MTDGMKYGEPDIDTARERIEGKIDAFSGGPEPGWERMEQAAREAKLEQSQKLPTGRQANPNESDAEDNQLSRPVATETDSY